MKTITTFLLLFISLGMYAQDPMLQKNDEVLEDKADKITEMYVPELGLTSKQELLFQKKVEEFLISAEKINNQYSGKDKLDRLVVNQQQETAEMGDILTRPQLNRYKKLKTKFQPLATVEKN